VKRITTAHHFEIFFHGFFHVDKGLFHTIKELFIRPGTMLRNYIAGKRVYQFNPYTYLVIVSLLLVVLHPLSGMIENASDNLFASKQSILFTSKHINYRLLLSIPVYTILSWILFRKYKYNLSEHFIIYTYLISQAALIFALWFPLLFLAKSNDIVFGIVLNCWYITGIIYQIWAIADLFNADSAILRWGKSILVVLPSFAISFLIINLLVKSW
jgi:hypothetical protein